MANDGQIVFEITADGKKAIANVRDVTEQIKRETSKWDNAVDNASDNMSKSFAKALDINRLKDWGIQAAKVIIDFGKQAIDAASDLQEVQNVVDTTFGSGASKIDAWAKQAGLQFGLTETQAKKFTSTLGAMMKSSGLAGNEIIDMSTDLAGLAADMASFYNLDFETAFQKIRSGISGETEPLKQLGINMSVANMEAFALQKGLSKTWNQMTQGEQTLLRYQYMMQATADAQGDFARTADGFANAQRRIETAVESIKTNVGTVLLGAFADATAGIAEFLEKLSQTPERTVIDEFNDIDIDTASKLAALDETLSKAQAIIGVIKDLEGESVVASNGSVISLAALFQDLREVENSGGDIREYLQSLGVDVDYVAQKYQVWQQSFKELERLVPGLTSDIFDQSDAINGTSEALENNLAEWQSMQEKKIAWAAYYAKKRALKEKEAELVSYELDAGTASKQRELFEAQNPRLKEEYDKYGLMGVRDSSIQGHREYLELLLAEKDAIKTNTDQVSAFDEANKKLDATRAYLIEKYGEEAEAAQEATDAVETYNGKTKEEWDELRKKVDETSAALKEYVDGVREATRANIESTLSGFNHIDTAEKAYKDAANAAKELREELKKTGKYTDKEIEIKVNAKNAQVTLQGLTDNLKSQLDFIKEYQANLQKARDLGVSDEILASLSDGSQESAQYLHAITEAYKGWKGEGVPQDIQELNALYKEVNTSKEKFADDLTQQKLTVDKTYDAMVAKAKESISALGLENEAANAMGQTVAGIAKGIVDHASEVGSAVDTILAELNRLNSYKINIDLGSFGSLNFSLDGSHATGLDYVPFDGYLAELHAGEGILTEEENRIWQRFKNGQGGTRNVDYDAIGGLMRDNVKPGGDVYLDGRVVGQVVSQMQGNQYRALQRSGWQQ